MTYAEWENNLKKRGYTVTVVGETYGGKTAVYVKMSDYNGYYVGWDFNKNKYEILGGKENARYWLSM